MCASAFSNRTVQGRESAWEEGRGLIDEHCKSECYSFIKSISFFWFLVLPFWTPWLRYGLFGCLGFLIS